jgi:hypothetical protein
VHVSFLFIAYESSYTHKYIHLSHIYLSAFRDRGVPGPTSKLSSRAPAQMGRRETEREGGGGGKAAGEETGVRGGNPAAFVFVPRPGRVRLQ